MKPILTLILLALSTGAHAAETAEVKIQRTKLSKTVHMLQGQGGNIGVSAGKDGVFLIDDQFAALNAKIRAAVEDASSEPIRFIINTHWHFDHTGGNEEFAKTGSVLIAHENVRKQMSVDHFIKAFNKEVPKSPEGALPVITFTRKISLHLNGETVDVLHVPNAHTDGDAIVHFTGSNVIHTGDTFFNGFYPYIDVATGGSLQGMILATKTVLRLADARTKIIPGHGPLATKADLLAYLKMLRQVNSRVRSLIKKGKSREEIIAAKPLRKLSKTWGHGFLKPEKFTGIAYDAVRANEEYFD